MSLNKTLIPWVKNPDGTQGYSWNPITGCLNGCEYCYARKLANTRLKARYLANDNLAGGYRLARGVLKEGAVPPNLNPFYPRFWVSRAGEPYHHKDSRGIFVCDMGELFGDWLPKSWQESVFTTIVDNPQHRFYLLTKQPQNLIKFSPFPENCWVGVSATDTKMLMQACSDLEEVRAKVKYLSVEPFLDWSFSWTESYLVNTMERANIKQVIIGAQTKPYKPPKIEWVKEIIEVCDKAGVKVFLKDNLRKMWGYTSDIKIRQEMPK